MKERIARDVFLFTFLVCLVTGSYSFIREQELFDPLALWLGGLINFLSWFALYRQKKNPESSIALFATDRRMGVYYLLTAALFVILTLLSFHFAPEVWTPACLFLCAVTQLIGYRVFIRQQRETARNKE